MSSGSTQATETAPGPEQVALQTFQRNFDALHRRDPTAAALISSASRPAGSMLVYGRDQEITLRFASADRGSRWFARCSMPSIAAAEGLSGFVHEGGSVALPGVNAGWEARELAAKLPPGAAVFVIEDDPSAAHIALHLVDLSEWISAGRVIFLLGAHWPRELGRLVERFPGHALPKRIVTVPQRSGAEITTLQQRLESAVAAASEAQNAALQASVTAIRDRGEREGAIETVTVVGGDESPEGLDFARRIARGLEALCNVTDVCLPDRPQHQHLAASLRAIEAGQPDLTIVAGLGLNALNHIMPPGRALRLIPEDRYASFRQDAAGRGAPAHPFPPAADHAAIERGGERQKRAANSVLFVADAPDDRPCSIGIQLTSQEALWNAMRARAAKLARTTSRLSADDLFHHAGRTTGAVMREEDVREEFIRLAEHSIIPAARLRREREALEAVGAAVSVLGAGFELEPRGPEADLRPPATAAEASTESFMERFRATSIVVFAGRLPLLGERIMDALACGCGVVVAESAMSDQLLPALRPVHDRFQLYDSPDALAKIVAGSLRSDDAIGKAAGRELPPDCSTTARLRKILAEFVR